MAFPLTDSDRANLGSWYVVNPSCYPEPRNHGSGYGVPPECGTFPWQVAPLEILYLALRHAGFADQEARDVLIATGGALRRGSYWTIDNQPPPSGRNDQQAYFSWFAVPDRAGASLTCMTAIACAASAARLIHQAEGLAAWPDYVASFSPSGLAELNAAVTNALSSGYRVPAWPTGAPHGIGDTELGLPAGGQALSFEGGWEQMTRAIGERAPTMAQYAREVARILRQTVS